MDTADAADRVSGTNLSDPLPTGTVTILFTDVEGSTRLWEMNPTAMKESLARHNAILHEAVRSHRGQIVKEMGDGMLAVFPTAHDALAAAAEAQANLASTAWGDLGPLQVRMSLHTGEPEIRGGDYFGPVLNRAARLMAAANGGQVIVSKVTEGILRDALPEGFDLIDLGEHRLRDLSRPERVFQLTAPGLASRFPQLHSLEALRGNLPTELSSFIGREREVTTVTKALAEARLVTLTGVGGVGKTRLALQVAADLLPDFPDGGWLCELAPVRDADAVTGAVASTFGLKASPGTEGTEALVEFLRSKRLLLVLDNCEHLLEGTGQLVRELAQGCPKLAVLATSREGLGIDGERLIVVPSLRVPSADSDVAVVAESEAARLFVDRAAAVKSGFELNATNAASVAEVCRRLDGIPLALELAAARVSVISPAELAHRLNQRFQLLAGGRRGAIERHQTLRAAIDWSYALLTEAEQRVLARLSVFAGGCTLEAAEAVVAGTDVGAAAVFPHLANLVSRSLVTAETDSWGETRYRLLETIRQYAEECLEGQGGTNELRARHAQYFVGWLDGATAGLRSPDESIWTRRVGSEQENLRATMVWAVDSDDADTALRLLGATLLIPMTYHRAAGAIAASAEAALQLSRADRHPLVVAAWLHAAMVAWGDTLKAKRFIDEAAAAERRLGARPASQIAGLRANQALASGGADEAIDLWEQSVKIARSNGDLIQLTEALGQLSQFRFLSGQTDTAIVAAREGVAVARNSGHPSSIAFATSFLGVVLKDIEPEEASQLLRESIQLGEGPPVPISFAVLAIMASRRGDHRAALELATQAIDRQSWFDERRNFGHTNHLLAKVLAEQMPELAAAFLGTRSRVDQWWYGFLEIVRLRDEITQKLTRILGESRFHELFALGTTMNNQEVFTYARTQIDIAHGMVSTGVHSVAPT